MIQSAECASLSAAEICATYESGVGVPTIMRMIGRSQCYVDRVLDQGGVVKRGAGRMPGKPAPDKAKPVEIKVRALDLYRSGLSAKEIERTLPVSKGTVLKWAREADIEIRYQRIDDPDLIDLHDQGCSAREISRRTGRGRKVVLARLHEAGRDVRAKAHAKWYWHESPHAGRVRLHGTWELAYAHLLDAWCSSGRIASWEYEPGALKFAPGLIYRPDFRVTNADGTWAYHEVKGAMWGRAAQKIAITRANVAPVVLVRRPLIDAACRAEKISVALS